jgi:chemotaxis protein methyltransferase CheR
MLTRAEAGRFSQLEINRGLPAPMLVRHFEREGANWRVSAALRSAITFKRLNLAAALPPLPQFDVIFLRNVLIYFDVETKRQVLKRISNLLRPDGWLFLGAAETTIGIDDRFERVSAGRSSAYRLRAALAGTSGGPVSGTSASAATPGANGTTTTTTGIVAPRAAGSLPIAAGNAAPGTSALRGAALGRG